jgi:OFA family oxalate/formate antiporter-like MFS transporter
MARDQHPYSRGTILFACMVAMMAVANLQYAWTLFTTPLVSALGSSLTRIQLAFSFFVVAQTGLLPINAYLVDRFGARVMLSIAGPLVAIGWVGAGLAASLPALYASSAIGGLGAGIVYGACIGLAMKWFPDRRGLCVGAVAGSYGFGTSLTVLPIARMIETSGYGSALIVWGVIQGAVVVLAAQFVRMPPSGWQPAGWKGSKPWNQNRVQQSTRDYTWREMLRTRSFYVMYFMMMIVAASGLMVTAQLKPIAESYGFDRRIAFGTVTVLSLAILIDGVMNGLTRPLFGWISDHLGRYNTMFLAFVLEAVAITGLTRAVHQPFWFVTLAGLTFFAWGEIYSLFPSATADLFGSKYATTNFGIQYTSKGIASLLAGPGAALVAAGGSWIPVLWVGILCNLVAAVLALLWLRPMATRLISRSGIPGATVAEPAPHLLEQEDSVATPAPSASAELSAKGRG